ncbi:MAG: CbiX/SirB N-terminal domain-containing protein [Verrucomicrobiae bacterium]
MKNAALVIAGHGSTRNPDSSSPTLRHAEEIRSRAIFSEVVCCFWKEKPSYREALGMVDSRDVFVVPNFISDGHFTRTIIPREMGLDGPVTRRGERTIRYCEPTGNHARMTDLLLAEARRSGAPPSETSLLIVGHGTGRDENSMAAAGRQARRIAETGLYAEVLAAFMEVPPLLKDWDTFTSQPNVVVVPFFLSDGLHASQDIPALLGIKEANGRGGNHRMDFTRNPHPLRGRQLCCGRAIGTDPGLADIILDQVAGFPMPPASAAPSS